MNHSNARSRNLPVVALVGRPNVGKSTLFNRLTKSRDALVADLPGLTRDRKYGRARFGGQEFIVIDTGGITGDEEGVDGKMAEQSLRAAEEADVVLFMTDARAGVVSSDMEIAGRLRRMGKQVFLTVNKTDGLDAPSALAEFHQLGLGDPIPISATQNRGLKTLVQSFLEPFVDAEAEEQEPSLQDGGDEDRNITLEAEAGQSIRIAVIGRPNVGKSTLVNRLLGEERVVVFDLPGTTRDSIYIDMERRGQAYTLIDTAGVRRRAKVHEAVEKFSIIKTLQAIEDAHVVIMVIDAREGVTEQDMGLLGYVLDAGRSLVVAVNKWDGLDAEQKQAVKEAVKRRLQFVDFAEKHMISALHGTGVGDLFDAAKRAWQSAHVKMTTRQLTEWLQEAQYAHQPPLVHGRRIKLRMAHPGGHNPPWIVIHGNQTRSLPLSYRRYLGNFFREKLKLVGTPVRFEFKSGENPYAGKKNALNERQLKKRSRLIKFVKKSEKKRKKQKTRG
jgi:GTP-binding protein